MTRILFVCLANICRSPMAQSVTEAMAATRAAGPPLRAESAGLHVARGGAPPDPRALAALKRRGYTGSRMRSREIRVEDFARFDLILAMDRMILAELVALCPAGERHKLELFLDYADGRHGQEIADPYFGGAQGFENVLDLCEAGARGLLSEIDLRAGP
ncbi:MAG: low molecular weight protein-tyrosine-phosphatase [Caldimonas sp.]